MNFNEIRRKAMDMDINTHRMKKSDLIQAIQRTENNMECFATERVDYCHEEICLWRNDCLSSNSKAKANPS